MRSFSIVLLIFVTFVTNAQDKPAYRVFTGEGKKADYQDMLKQALRADVVFFGELHDNPIAHWLELELTKDLHAEKGSNLILAAEMFERDNQIIIDEYFSDLIKESSFETEARLWKNYGTDYKPLLTFAKKNNLQFVASNIPRRYASIVSSGGFEALQKISDDGRKNIAPLPIDYDPELACYKDMLNMNMGPKGPNPENFPKAQAIKDATMANSIVKYRQQGQMVIHYNGSYHSDRYQGILWYLNRYSPSTKSVTITTVLQDETGKMSEESMKMADFVIVIPTSMTRTYK
ncbi:MAG: ChaN family lipoprotein [Bacteroidetes bacterium]|nr:ChaN family lipoprotein [Bacteroidota bacterium]